MNWVIIGNGGHSKVICDMVNSFSENRIVAILDDKYEEMFTENDILLAPVSSAMKLMTLFENLLFVIAVGNNKTRQKIVNKLDVPIENYGTVIHKTAVISSSAVIGNGSVVMANSVVNAEARVGMHSIINTKSVVEHENELGDFVHVSPGVTLTGAVIVDEGVHIGAGATVIPSVHIGEWTVIGAGATVINDIPAFCTAVGIPARVKMKNVIGGV